MWPVSPARTPASSTKSAPLHVDMRFPDVSVPNLEPTTKLVEEERTLSEVKRERDQAWKRAQSLEHSLEIERHTSRAVATEAVEAEAMWEARVAELMSELAQSESRLQSRHLVDQEQRQHVQEHLLQDIHDKMMVAVCQGEELKQSLFQQRCQYSSPSVESSCRGSASIPLQPCSWFATQGTPCNHARENAQLLERLLLVTEQLQTAEAAKKLSAQIGGCRNTLKCFRRL